MTTLSIFWFTFPLAIIGFVLFLQGRKSAELVDIGIDGAEFGVSGINGYPESDSKRILKMDIYLNAIPRKRVDTIQLDIADNLIPPDWQPDYIPMQISTSGIYYFNIPDSVKQNKYISRLIISLENKKIKSKPFKIEVPICPCPQ